MEIIIVLLVIVVLLIINRTLNDLRRGQEGVEKKMDQLLRETWQLKKDIQGLSKQNAGLAPQPIPEQRPTTPAASQQPLKPAEPILQTAPPQKVVTPPPVPAQAKMHKPTYAPPPMSKESWSQQWLRNNPDLEKFIGENLINKIGIAILVLGISFFVKYAIDKNWISEAGRVSIGLFCGGILIGLAHFLRKSYRSFSSVLAGGGIAIFYFTIAFAFHQYHLLSQTAAFLLMVVITGFAITLSLLYNKLELAVIAAIGGYVTPFLVSTGQGNYIILFTYLIILSSGLLSLSFFKRWPLVNILAFLFTELIFGGWLFTTQQNPASPISYPLALLFASVLYLLFLGMNIIYQIRYKKPFKAFDYTLLISLNASYYAAGLTLLEYAGAGAFGGVFTLGIGLLNLLLAWAFFKRQQVEKNFVYLLIGLTLTFITLTVPIQLHGHAITLFWLAEMVLLFWLYQRSRISLFYFSSLLVMAAGSISLLIDWVQTATNDSTAITLMYSNLQGIVTNVVAVLSFAAYAQLVKKETSPLPGFVSNKRLQWVGAASAVVISYLTAIYGVNLIFKQAADYDIPNVYHRLVAELYVVLILLWLQRKHNGRFIGLGIGVVAIYLVYHLLSISFITGLRNSVLANTSSFVHLAAHWASVAAACALAYHALRSLLKVPFPYLPPSRLGWIISIILVIFFSQEAKHLFISLFYNGDAIMLGEEQYKKAVLTIVWGLCSFGAMWLGMRYKNKTVRIISLTLFSMALIKLFFFDLADLSEGGKIAAFILLGVLLLTISFMYQKLKKIIIDERP